jgi:riboflavin transporter FmnP
MRSNNKKYDTRTIVGVGIFIALAYVISFFKVEILHLSFNAKEAILIIESFIFGPVAGVVSAFILSLLEMITSGTGPYGALMNFVSSAVYALAASLIYLKLRKMWGAVLSLGVATVLTTAVMMVMNILITPLYITGVTTGAVVDMIPTLLLPFNFAKYLFNSAITLVLYKPVLEALRRAKLMGADKSSANGTISKTNTLISLISAGVLLVTAIIIFVVVVQIN